MFSLTAYLRDVIDLFKDQKEFIPINPKFLLEIVERIEFLEARQTELQEEGTKLVTERRELKAEIERLKAL